jgi:hypothetical protein
VFSEPGVQVELLKTPDLINPVWGAVLSGSAGVGDRLSFSLTPAMVTSDAAYYRVRTR